MLSGLKTAQILALRFVSDHDQRLTQAIPCPGERHGGAEVSKGEAGTNRGCKIAPGHRRKKLLPDGGGRRLLVHATELTQINANQGRSLEQRQVDRQRRNRPAGKSDDQMPAAPGQAAECRFQNVPAHRVEDHIDTPIRREGLESAPPLRVGVVNAIVCTLGQSIVPLLCGRCGRR